MIQRGRVERRGVTDWKKLTDLPLTEGIAERTWGVKELTYQGGQDLLWERRPSQGGPEIYLC